MHCQRRPRSKTIGFLVIKPVMCRLARPWLPPCLCKA